MLDVLRGFYAMRTLGRRYFASPWHWWEWTGIALLIAAAVCRYQQFRGMRAIELHLEAALGAFADFRAVAVYAQAELGLTALAALVVYTKALHYLAGVPRFGALLRSVARASTHLAPLVLGLAALLGGQSVAFTLAFGTQGHAWRSVGDATMSLYLLLLGATHDSAGPFALRHTNWVLGPLLYAFVVLLFYLVLLRFVLAVVQEAWALEARCIDRNVHTSLVLRQASPNPNPDPDPSPSPSPNQDEPRAAAGGAAAAVRPASPVRPLGAARGGVAASHPPRGGGRPG